MRNDKRMNGCCKIAMILLIIAAYTLKVSDCRGQDSLLVTGTISAGINHPLPGVSVSVEGVYSMPSITDENGDFRLYAPSGNVWLIIAPTEKFKSRRIYLNNRMSISIQLTQDDLVSGYDEIPDLYRPSRRRDLVSAYYAPELRNLNLYPYQSIDQYFQGFVQGLLVTGRSGMPGSGTTSHLRGIRSMFTNNQPLYIVDGLPMEPHGLFESNIDGNEYNPLATLDPNDITDITILKDYLGAAKYGMRASNGVILIETLKPTELQTTIDVSMRTGFSLRPEQIPQLNGNQFKTLANELLISSGQLEEEYKERYPALFNTPDDEEHYRYNHNTDWQDMVFSNGLMYDFFLRVRGGDEIARYGLSVSYLDHKGIIENTYYKRFNVRFVSNFNIFKWLGMYVSSNLTTGNSELKESARITQTSPLYTSLAKSPLLNPYKYDENGNEIGKLENVGPLGISNPLAITDKFTGNNNNYRFATSFRVVGDITRHLQWNSIIGINLNTLNEAMFLPNTGMELYYDSEAHNVSRSLKNHLFSLYSDNHLGFSKELNSKHHFSSAAGFRLMMNSFQIDRGLTKNLHENDEYNKLQDGTDYLMEMGGRNAKWNRIAFYGNGGYNYKSKYFINANLTIENSTRIGKKAEGVTMIGGQPYGVFHSAGGAWRISSESFLKNITWLEDLKLRASYGIVGNDDIGNLSALEYYTVVKYNETSGMIPGPATNQSIKFEVNRQLNTGLDIGLWGNKFNLSVDLYQTRTKDLLVFEPQESYSGFTSIPSNNGELLNKGWETTLFSRVLDRGKFKWDLGLNLSQFKNSVVQIKDDQVITPFTGGEFISRVGEPVLSFYGYIYDGVFASGAEAEEAGLVTEKGIPFGAGDARFIDLSGPDGLPDKVINEYDKTIIGSPIPELYGGFHSHFSYGRWSLTANLQFVYGLDAYNYLRHQNEKMTDLSNQSTNVLNRWFAEGQVTDVPRATWDDPVGNAAFSSRWIEDGSYLRLKNLTLAYTVREKFLVFQNVQIYVTGTNLYTWHSYLGYDPEFSFSSHVMEQGIDYGLMPHARKFMFGIKFGL